MGEERGFYRYVTIYRSSPSLLLVVSNDLYSSSLPRPPFITYPFFKSPSSVIVITDEGDAIGEDSKEGVRVNPPMRCNSV
jgi:hypothetical protein